MIRWSAALQHPDFRRVAVYALLAAVATTLLFAADGAYRGYRTPSPQATAPLTGQRSAEIPEPAPVETPAAASPSQVLTEAPQRETGTIGERDEAPPATAQAQTAGSNSDPASHPAGGPAANTMTSPAAAPSPRTASGTEDVVLPPERPKLSQTPERPRAQRPSTKRAPRDRTSARRPAQAAKPPVRAAKPPVRAAKPNVYWERDSQLGFAPQLRKRTCNPATGHMPMQCYYPRENRERFPAKPLN